MIIHFTRIDKAAAASAFISASGIILDSRPCEHTNSSICFFCFSGSFAYASANVVCTTPREYFQAIHHDFPVDMATFHRLSFRQRLLPPHDGHPCLRLTVPTAKPVADLHRLATVHARHTPKTPCYRYDSKGFHNVFMDS